MIARTLRRAGTLALDLLYPPRCALCEQEGAFLCDACAAKLPRADGDRCDACWLPLNGPACRNCAAHPLSTNRLRSVFRYEGEVRRLVHAFKFGHQGVLAGPLGTLLAEAYREQGLEADVVVPVPLTAARRRWRGYDQALLLAREAGELNGLTVERALRRKGSALPQAESQTAEQRRLNVIGVFEAVPAVDVSGRRVLLIDDVATTGSTLSACAGVLLAAGAAEITGLTLARED